MSSPLKVERLTPNGEIYTADLIASIAKYLRQVAALPRGAVGRTRPAMLRAKADQLDALAKSLEPTP